MNGIHAAVIGADGLAHALAESGRFEHVHVHSTLGSLKAGIAQLSALPNQKLVFLFADNTPNDIGEGGVGDLAGRLVQRGYRVAILEASPEGRKIVAQHPGAGLIPAPVTLNIVLGALSDRGVGLIEPVPEKWAYEPLSISDPNAVSLARQASGEMEAPAGLGDLWGPEPAQPAQPGWGQQASPAAWPAQPGDSPNPWGQQTAPQPAQPAWGQQESPGAWGQEPVQPVAPAWGQEPVQPVAPAWGQEPAQPVAPAWGQDPAQPTQPSWGQDPVQPVAPAWGQEPAQPGWGLAPEQPDVASWGEEPTQNTPSTWGQEPVQPVAPAWGQDPAQPTQPSWGQQASPAAWPAQPAATPSPWGQQTAPQPAQPAWGQQESPGVWAPQPGDSPNPWGQQTAPQPAQPAWGQQGGSTWGVQPSTLQPAGWEQQPGMQTMPTSKRRGFVISVCVAKGGAGKSSLTLNLGVWLGLRLRATGRNVCIVDANWQQADIGKQINAYTPNIYGLSQHAREHMHPAHIGQYLYHRQDLGNTNFLLGPARVEEANPMWINAQLYSNAVEVLRQLFDYVIIDTPVAEFHHELFTDFIIPQSDFLVVPVIPNWPTFINTDSWLRAITQPANQGGLGFDERRVGIILNRAESEVGIDEKDVQTELSSWEYLGSVPNSSEWVRSANESEIIATRNYAEINHAFAGILYRVTGEEVLLEGLNSGEPEKKSRRGIKGLFGR